MKIKDLLALEEKISESAIKEFLAKPSQGEYARAHDYSTKINIDNQVYDLNNLPDHMYVHTSLDLNGKDISKLPNNLHINGNLDIGNTKIERLPDFLYVGGDFGLDNLIITNVADNLDVQGDCDLRTVHIVRLPKNTHIGGHLVSSKDMINLPDSLYVGGNLHLEDSKVSVIKDNIKVGGQIFARRGQIKSAAKDLKNKIAVI